MDNSLLESLPLDRIACYNCSCAAVLSCRSKQAALLLARCSVLAQQHSAQMPFDIVDPKVDVLQQQAAYGALNLVVGSVCLCGGHAASLKDAKGSE